MKNRVYEEANSWPSNVVFNYVVSLSANEEESKRRKLMSWVYEEEEAGRSKCHNSRF